MRGFLCARKTKNLQGYVPGFVAVFVLFFDAQESSRSSLGVWVTTVHHHGSKTTRKQSTKSVSRVVVRLQKSRAIVFNRSDTMLLVARCLRFDLEVASASVEKGGHASLLREAHRVKKTLGIDLGRFGLCPVTSCDMQNRVLALNLQPCRRVAPPDPSNGSVTSRGHSGGSLGHRFRTPDLDLAPTINPWELSSVHWAISRPDLGAHIDNSPCETLAIFSWDRCRDCTMCSNGPHQL